MRCAPLAHSEPNGSPPFDRRAGQMGMDFHVADVLASIEVDHRAFGQPQRNRSAFRIGPEHLGQSRAGRRRRKDRRARAGFEQRPPVDRSLHIGLHDLGLHDLDLHDLGLHDLGLQGFG